MTVVDRYPWHASQWQEIERRLTAGRLPHALLLCGPEGLGKGDFALRLSVQLLCQAKSAIRPCGECKNCQLSLTGNHPDIRWVTLPENKSQIGVDQIRDLSEYLCLTSQSSSYKIAIIYPAEKMNLSSANSLLKTLEEPSKGSLLILVSHQPGRLPATVRSRCQMLTFTRPAPAQARSWLKDRLQEADNVDQLLCLADGLPLRALALEQHEAVQERTNRINELLSIVRGDADPVKTAAIWLKLGAKSSLYWLYSWITDMARLSMSSGPPYLANPDLQEALSEIAEILGPVEVIRRLDCTRQAIASLDSSLNTQLLLEDVLIPWRYGLNLSS